MAELQRQALSSDNPWPGLDPFDETDSQYFHGREAESRELLRLVRRELLTVLFGRSGLGKTSLLKAGLFPRLREEDCLPVYLRLDHAEGAPALREQVFRGLQRACEDDRVQAEQPAGDETLWSFFHRRDAEFWNDRNRLVTPVIVLDQFEEIFTLGQKTEATRAHSVAFLDELSHLVENRPPETVRQALEDEPTAARRFDFKRSAVKLVLSFREDFLAEMEGLKEKMPSLMYNRFRLLAMSGSQAYDVITHTGLVDDDVARRIIRLAWKNELSPPVDPSEFPKIEIDPALLSVVCSELNHKRRQASPRLDRITTALLEDADREILSGFYERGMAGLDPRVRAFVEDELITMDGLYRDSHALDNALALPGITSEALDTLITRRLLRVDERRSMRRLELTHDVLVRVVRRSRDSRRAREAEQAVLAQQRRNRRNAAFVAAGALVVVALAGLASWFAWKASRAEVRAQETLLAAERARMVANADWLQKTDYGASLLVNLAAVRIAGTLDAQAALLRRLLSHPHLSTFLRGHNAGVRGVAFSPNGRRLASASWDNTVILWDVAERKLLARLERHGDRVACVAFSPDGKWLASAGEDRIVLLWDIDRPKPTARPLAGHKDSIFSVAFSPDGKRLASAGEEGTVLVWDVASRKPLTAPLEGHRAPVRSVAFSPDGGLLASGSEDMSVILWDARRFRRLTRLGRHEDMVNAVAFSPDGTWLASASEDQTVILWDVASREPLDTFEEHQGAVYGVAFSPDGTRLASASDDQTVILWDVDSHEPLVTLEGHEGAVNGVAFGPDGTHLASASDDQTVILWDLASRKLQVTLEGNHGAVEGLAFTPDGKRLGSRGDDKIPVLWDVVSRKLLDTRTLSDAGIDRSPDGLQPDPMGRGETAIDSNLEVQRTAFLNVAFSPDGKLMASAGGDGTVVLRDAGSNKALATLEGHEGRVKEVAFSPDGKRLASGGADGKVILWNLDLSSLKAEVCRTANRNLTCEEWRSYISTELSYQKSCEALPGPETCD